MADQIIIGGAVIETSLHEIVESMKTIANYEKKKGYVWKKMKAFWKIYKKNRNYKKNENFFKKSISVLNPKDNLKNQKKKNLNKKKMSSEPQSLSNSQFCSLGSFNYNSINFFHHTFNNIIFYWIRGVIWWLLPQEVWNLQIQGNHSQKLGKNKIILSFLYDLQSFNLKLTSQFKKSKSGTHHLSLTDEYKFGFPYQRYFLQTRVKRNGDVKFHLDGGNVVILYI